MGGSKDTEERQVELHVLIELTVLGDAVFLRYRYLFSFLNVGWWKKSKSGTLSILENKPYIGIH